MGNSPLNYQFILGTTEFMEKIKPALKDKAELKEIAKRERLVSKIVKRGLS